MKQKIGGEARFCSYYGAPLMVSAIVKELKEKRVEKAISLLDEYKMSFEFFNENCVEMMKKSSELGSLFENLSTGIKADFKKKYKATHTN